MRPTLKVTTRNKTGKQYAKKIRQEGKVPGVIYGHGEKSFGVLIDQKEFLNLIDTTKSESTILEVMIDDKDKVPCIIKSIQRNPLNDRFLNIDFQHIHLSEKITVRVPIILKGEAPGIKQGGVLDHRLHEVEIKCLPDDVLSRIEVDISQLKIGETLHIGYLHFDKVEFLLPKDAPIVSVLVPKEVAPAAAPVEETKEPELIREKKEAKEEDAETTKGAKAEKPKEEKPKEKEKEKEKPREKEKEKPKEKEKEKPKEKEKEKAG